MSIQSHSLGISYLWGGLTWLLHSVIHSLLSVEWIIVDVVVQFPESRGSYSVKAPMLPQYGNPYIEQYQLTYSV